MIKLKIWWLKRQAKKHYQSYRSLLELNMADCGFAMFCEMVPSVKEHALKFNEVMDRLSEIDSSTPEYRVRLPR